MKVAVVGAGVAGRAIVRALSDRGDQVSLVSPSPWEVPGLWVRGDAVTGRGLKPALADAEVAIWAAWSDDPRDQVVALGPAQLARAAERRGIERLLVLGPAAPHPLIGAWRGAVAQCREQIPSVCALRVPALFGEDDHLTSPWLARARQGRGFAVRGAALELRPLWTGDLARLVLAALDGAFPWDGIVPDEATGDESTDSDERPEGPLDDEPPTDGEPPTDPGAEREARSSVEPTPRELSVQGGRRVRVSRLADAVAQRFGVSWRRSWRRAPAWLAAPSLEVDLWEALVSGDRLDVSDWLRDLPDRAGSVSMARSAEVGYRSGASTPR